MHFGILNRFVITRLFGRRVFHTFVVGRRLMHFGILNRFIITRLFTLEPIGLKDVFRIFFVHHLVVLLVGTQDLISLVVRERVCLCQFV